MEFNPVFAVFHLNCYSKFALGFLKAVLQGFPGALHFLMALSGPFLAALLDRDRHSSCPPRQGIFTSGLPPGNEQLTWLALALDMKQCCKNVMAGHACIAGADDYSGSTCVSLSGAESQQGTTCMLRSKRVGFTGQEPCMLGRAISLGTASCECGWPVSGHERGQNSSAWRLLPQLPLLGCMAKNDQYHCTCFLPSRPCY